MEQKERYAIEIHGIVQGVGFRPFVYGLAGKFNLTGWVLNSAAGLFIEIEGGASYCAAFLRSLKEEAPALSRINEIDVKKIEVQGNKDFLIRRSVGGNKNTLVSPDMGICEDCLKDIRDPHNRRFGYPFTNCTNCGPRFTIIRDLPYDRALTTMADFPLCDACRAEFENPANRRFHAQPNACADCGPQLIYRDNLGHKLETDPLKTARADIESGKIILVKGIGGYHLVCDARNEAAVAKLRDRKYRWHKPFALMMPDIATVRRYCQCDELEAALLKNQRRPIVLLQIKKEGCRVAEQVAPHNKSLGIMLPYMPVHYLLIEGFEALVMTSANYADEPIVYEDADAIKLMKPSGPVVSPEPDSSPATCTLPLADACLTHNRKIFRRCDDSVMVCPEGEPVFIRRSRGYAPEPLQICDCGKQILGVGGEQKNTFCLTRKAEAFVSQHIGDLENISTYDSYKKEIAYFEKMFESDPEIVACDMHPQYLSTKYAYEESGIKKVIPVQHHHAHLASVLAEHHLVGPAIGLIYDGTGYGTDHTLWGGEVLVGDIAEFRRAAHLLYTPLPGGEKAIREPWRIAMSCLLTTFGEEALPRMAPPGLLAENWPILLQAVNAGINSPLTSGMGRLFDAAAALTGIGRYVSYEGQAAVELEQTVDHKILGEYRLSLQKEADEYILDWRPLIEDLLKDIKSGAKKNVIATRFHRSIISMSRDICQKIREETGINTVVLSGGCWQNMFLLTRCRRALHKQGFGVYCNSLLPINDGGIAYGQAAVAAEKVKRGEI